MDVNFVTQGVPMRKFSIEIGFFDTVSEIKQKIQKYQGTLVFHQTLIFNGKVLEAERVTLSTAWFPNQGNPRWGLKIRCSWQKSKFF